MKKLCSWLSILFIFVMIDTKMIYANPIEIEQNEKILTEHVVSYAFVRESTKSYSYENEKLISVLYEEKYYGVTSKTEVKYIYDESGKIVRKDVFQLEATLATPQEEPVESVLYLYDAKGQLIAEINAFTSEILVLYFYDERGNMIQKQEGENVYTYFYDCKNNMTDEEYCKATQVERRWHYKYDDTGRKVARIDEEGSETYYSYDDEGNIYNPSDVIIYDGKGRTVFCGSKDSGLYGYKEYTYVD